MPGIVGVLETSLYVDNVARSMEWYQALFGFPVILQDERIGALRVREGQVLLLFKKGASTKPMPSSEGTLPGHDGSGNTHVAFSVAAAELPGWETYLSDHGIAIDGIMNWKSGSRSVYFRDLDGHLLELATPGIWNMTW